MEKTQTERFAILRIIFGLVWLIDASFKWSAGFLNNFSDYLSLAAQSQPGWIVSWINFNLKIISLNPHAFALAVAVLETGIALSLIFGLLTKPALLAAFILSLLIWSTAEGFGGPYAAGSTDIGCAVIYSLMCAALWLGGCWEAYSLDSKLFKKLNGKY